MNRINAILRVGNDIAEMYDEFNKGEDMAEQFHEELNLWKGIEYGIRHH